MPELGICFTHHGGELTPPAAAVAAEARGLDLFFVPENSHVPLERPGTPRQFDGIRRLADFHDPFITLAACAAVTRRIRLGTSVCLLTQREPAATAHTVASLDHLSDGRVIFGVAGGFIREAMENFGSPFESRWKIVRERVLAMRSVWSDARPGYRGDYVEMGPLPAPSPARQPAGPPVWIGSNSKWVPARVADYADGWLARPALYEGDPVADLRRACEARERRFDELSVALMGAPDDPGAAEACLARGYSQLIWFVGEETATAALNRLDQIAGWAGRLRADCAGGRAAAG
ncbi:MAG: TIGR03619 family F420-dependent LLM class oxidoreductase [Gammaproteobacteria bacterium]